MVVAEVAPFRVTAGFPSFRRRHLVALEPARDVIVIELQAPAHSRESLPHHHRFFVGRPLRAQGRVILVGFTAPVGLRLRERVPEVHCSARSVAGQPELDLGSLSGSDRNAVPAGHLRPASFGIDCRRAIHDGVVDAILGIGRRSGASKEFGEVGLVVAKQKRGRAPCGIRAGGELPCAELLVLGDDHRARLVGHIAKDRFGNAILPGPAVAEPERRQDMELR
jgi:hypothetical protein